MTAEASIHHPIRAEAKESGQHAWVSFIAKNGTRHTVFTDYATADAVADAFNDGIEAAEARAEEHG